MANLRKHNFPFSPAQEYNFGKSHFMTRMYSRNFKSRCSSFGCALMNQSVSQSVGHFSLQVQIVRFSRQHLPSLCDLCIRPNRLMHPGHGNGLYSGNACVTLLNSGLWTWSKCCSIFCRLLCLPAQIFAFFFMLEHKTIAHIVRFKRTRHLPAHKYGASFVKFNHSHVECKVLRFYFLLRLCLMGMLISRIVYLICCKCSAQ